MAHFRGVKIEGTVLIRDDSVADFLLPFSAESLRTVTAIGDECFGAGRATLADFSDNVGAYFRRSHDIYGPSVLDLSLLENCTTIGASFAVGHYGPVILPPRLESVGSEFMMGAKFRVIDLPPSLQTIGKQAFRLVVAERVVLPDGLVRVAEGAFDTAELGALTIPGSVAEVGAEFCSQAVMETVSFEHSNASVKLRFNVFNDATVKVLVFRRSIDFKWNSGTGMRRTKVAVFQHFGASPLRNCFRSLEDQPFTGQNAPTIDTVVLGHVGDAGLFPESVFVLGDHDEEAQPAATAEPPTQQATNDEDETAPQSEPELIQDLHSITQLKKRHCRHFIIGSTVDMSMLTSCTTIGDACFMNLASVDVIKFPPNLTSIGHSFMKGAACPALDVAFPSTFRDLGERAMSHARLRSVDMGRCEGIDYIPQDLLDHGSVEFLALPPDLQRTRSGAAPCLAHLDCPKLDLVFPKNFFRNIGSRLLSHSTIRSLDFGQCDKIEKLPDGFLNKCTLSAFTFPPNVKVLGRNFMSEANSPDLDVVFPKTLQSTGLHCCSLAKLRSLDFRKCGEVLEMGPECFF